MPNSSLSRDDIKQAVREVFAELLETDRELLLAIVAEAIEEAALAEAFPNEDLIPDEVSPALFSWTEGRA